MLQFVDKVWQHQRKLINPTFNQRILYGFMPIFDKCVQRLIRNLATLPKGESVPMMGHMIRCSLEMVCETTIDTDVSEDLEAADVMEKVER